MAQGGLGVVIGGRDRGRGGVEQRAGSGRLARFGLGAVAVSIATRRSPASSSASASAAAASSSASGASAEGRGRRARGSAPPRTRCCAARATQNSASTAMTPSRARSYHALCTALLAELELERPDHPLGQLRDVARGRAREELLGRPLALQQHLGVRDQVRQPVGQRRRMRHARLAQALQLLAQPRAEVCVGLDRYRFMSCTSTATLRASASSPASCAWRVTFAAASGR